MDDKVKNILITIAYFIVAILFFGSMGVWLPLLIDNFNQGETSVETYNSIANNLLTYSLGLFLVASIDRIIHLFFKTSKYSNNVLEFFGIIILTILTGFLVFVSLKHIKQLNYEKAIQFARYIVLISWISWFYVKFQGTKDNNYSPIGGQI